LEVLRHCFSSSVRRTLEELPEGLDETYERILREIKKPNQRHAHRLLQCLVAAVRPLKLHELAEVLAFDFDAVDGGGIPELNPDWSLSLKDAEEAIMSACSNLVIIVKDRRGRRIVQFSHFSVKEFLTSNRLAEPIRDVSRYHIRLDDAHTILVRACLGILLGLKSELTDYFLPYYAAAYWNRHAQFEDVSSRIKDAMRCLFDADKPHFAIWVGLMKELDSDCDTDFPLLFAASFGFHDAAEHIIAEHPEQINAKNIVNLTPLHVAAIGGHTDILSLLLKHGADVDARALHGDTPLFSASIDGKLEAGRCLLDHGADINARARAWFNMTPVYIAAFKGHVEFARMLLERGAAMDVRPHMNRGYTPLTGLIELGKIQIVRLFLEYGEDVNECGVLGKSPSQWASLCKQQEILELLSEYGAESVE
jgi:Ankyrin repeats (3 copies)